MRQFFSFLLIALVCVGLTGCGGGGGGSGGGGPTAPNPSTIGNLVVRLRGPSGEIADGIVSVGDQQRGTTNGQATFNNLPVGSQSVSAEVGGQTTTGTATVAGGTTTNFRLTITPATNPGTGPPTPPTPPTF